MGWMGHESDIVSILARTGNMCVTFDIFLT